MFYFKSKGTVDKSVYSEGELQRFYHAGTSSKLFVRKKIFLNYKNHQQYPSPKRLDNLIKWSSKSCIYCTYYYHQSRFIKFL